MFHCFLCKLKFCNIKAYIGHLKLIHKVTKLSNLQCSHCPQSFQSLYSFKRHIQKHVENNSVIEKTVEANQLLNNSVLSAEKKTSSLLFLNDTDISQNSENLQNSKTLDNAEKSDTFSNINYDHLVEFFLQLYAKPSLSRKVVTEIINKISEHIVSAILENVERVLKFNLSMENMLIEIRRILDNFKEIIDNFNSEHKVLNYLRKNKLYFDSKEFLIDDCLTIDTISAPFARGVLLPIKDNLIQFFALPNILSDMLEKLENLKRNNDLRNIVQGSVWSAKYKDFENKIVLPYILYQDEFEINNPLGSKRGVDKLSAFYITFPLLQDSESSKLSSIFPCCFTKSSSLKHGNFANFQALCTELKHLEEGLIIETESGTFKIHLVLASVVGDNLGLNTVLGFCKSFSANNYCRLCKSSKTEMKKQIVENKQALRNEINYLEDIMKENVSATGIREMCIFNQLKFFKVTDCVSVDIMHDFLEGICHIELGHVLHNFIIEKGYFTVATLNHRKIQFDYGPFKSNISAPITLKHIKEKKFKMSSSEMKTFVHFLPIMLGDLIPKRNAVWSLLLLLIKLIDACFMPHFNDETISELKKMISEHHQLYMRLFKTTLTPKHHFMVHYPNVIQKLGPLKGLWTMRFEAKHKELKTYASIITSRRNICLSLATKVQFDFALNLYSKKYNKIKQNDEINKNILSTPDSNSNILSDMKSTESITFNNTLYKVNYVISLRNLTEFSFYVIKYIYISDNKNHIFECAPIRIKTFDNHLHCYVIDYVEADVSKIIYMNEIKYMPIHIITLYNKEKVLRTVVPFS